ncbi:MAG TPA: hypothetical protein VGR58_00675 [Candidatus Acidoferrum sp.]|nr:hypothetical protein [Candidatus Acidoferrum sp.]
MFLRAETRCSGSLHRYQWDAVRLGRDALPVQARKVRVCSAQERPVFFGPRQIPGS